MKKQLLLSLTLLAVILFYTEGIYGAGFSQPQPQSFDIAGTWLGTLKVASIELRIVFHISGNAEEGYKATMDSPDQGAKDIPVDSVVVSSGKVRLAVSIIKGFFEGTVSEDSLTLDGSWSQGGRNFPLVLKKVEKVQEANRPQEPKEPFPYKQEDVKYENKTAGITLAGTLTIPEGKGPFPAAILITGSGKQNRNEELMGHKPFLVLSDYLTRRGIAVLRSDDRGEGESTGDFSKSTSADFAGDVQSAFEFMMTRPEIDHNKIGLIGHSEGGLIAPMVAAENKDVAYIVMMAGPGLTGEQIILLQSKLIAEANGVDENQINKDIALSEKVLAIAKSKIDSSEAAGKIENVFKNYYEGLSEEDKKKEEYSEKAALAQIKRVLSPWFRYFLAYDPVPALEKVKCPVLAIDGEKDLQVPPKEDLAAIKAALEKGGNKNFEVKELPGLNHLFQKAETGSPLEYGKIDETIDPSALKIMGDWILKIVK